MDEFMNCLYLYWKGSSFSIKECTISIALTVGLITGVPALELSNNAYAATRVLPDLAVLISRSPIKDPGALEVQKPLEDITESLKIAGVKALDSTERNLRQASRALKQGKSLIVTGLAESKKDHGAEMLGKLEVGMDELQQIVEDKNRDEIAKKQKELLLYVGADGFFVQTGDPERPAEGFIDPSTEKTRTIPLEISVVGEKAPFYGATLEELGLYKAQAKLPFNAFGTMAMARDVRNISLLQLYIFSWINLMANREIPIDSVDRNLRTILLRARYFGY
ncbi:putative peptidylprolyl isomerase [Rosa chinensis]|uniref:peptidylprolyl isomerase n=1 Tax=Rosa chinensis TaxID=74649 RepID=A0A2P6S5C0_ROSCH|nr:putative peptidylprolyl isomerase [Rosa chinensis]